MSATELSCVVRRTLSAPIANVFRLWTDPELAPRWSWGSKYDTLSVDIDLRVGGIWRQQIRDRKTGEVWSFEGVFREVEPPTRLVHSFSWRSDRGAVHDESLVAIDFRERGPKTEVVITHTRLTGDDVVRGTEAGWIDICDLVDKIAPRASA
jgi:uncharacterized protein YndB with AHSA1/START domain